MKIESLAGSPDLLFLSYVLGVEMPRHWPHSVGGQGDEPGRVRVHFLRWLNPADLHYAESRIATHLPMTWAVEATCTPKRHGEGGE